MIFTEARFFLFFAVVFLVHWTLRRELLRKLWLLGCSYFFYAAWDWRFLSLIVISTVVDYGVARAIVAAKEPRSRRRWLLLSLLCNLGLLGVFKYFNFFSESLHQALTAAGATVSPITLSITLPVGISFYTFQTLSYTIDVYRGKLEPRKSILDMALFVAFFPQLVAGPIVRARDYLPQLDRPRLFSQIQVRTCLLLFLVGFIKKACISDNVSVIVDAYFASPLSFNGESAWLATVGYAVQIYCDFSGYSDMAIATAGLLGFNLCINFAHPYFASDIQVFWRRWHISLSSWLRDYLYIPLGGNKGGTLYRYRNLMLTMLLGGLWHGAAWQFVVWGGLHGIALVAHSEWSKRVSSPLEGTVVGSVIGTAMTFYWVCLAWIFFRAPGLAQALAAARAYLTFQGAGTEALSSSWWLLFALLGGAHFLAYRRKLQGFFERQSPWLFAGGYGFLWALALAFIPSQAAPFIYFQF